MDESPDTLQPESSPPTATHMSLAARLLNIFAIPGDVFQDVKSSGVCVSNWLVPAIIACVVGILSVNLIYSQPGILQQLREKQEATLEKAVQDGKMTKAEADRASALFAPGVLKVIFSISAAFWAFIGIFITALILTLVAKLLLKSPVPFLKAAEVAGLAGMISVLGGIVTLLLVVNLSNLTASPSLVLAVHDFDQKNRLHLLLGTANAFDIWHVAVLAIGLARLTSQTLLRPMTILFGLWAAWRLLMVFLGPRLIPA